MTVEKTRRFEEDFTAAVLYLAELNPSAARRFIDRVEATIALLAAHPHIGPAWRYDIGGRDVRFLLVKGFRDYLLFYRVEGDRLMLGRLMHGAQELRNLLF